VTSKWPKPSHEPHPGRADAFARAELLLEIFDNLQLRKAGKARGNERASIKRETLVLLRNCGTPGPLINLVRKFFKTERQANEFTYVSKEDHIAMGKEIAARLEAARPPGPKQGRLSNMTLPEVVAGVKEAMGESAPSRTTIENFETLDDYKDLVKWLREDPYFRESAGLPPWTLPEFPSLPVAPTTQQN